MPKLGKTQICILCNDKKPAKGRVCEKCRHEKRKANGDYKRYYRQNRDKILERIYPFKAKHRNLAIKHHGAKCFDCGWDKAKQVLHVHHIDSKKSNGNLSNLVMLCPTCHFYRHYKEKSGIFAQYLR